MEKFCKDCARLELAAGFSRQDDAVKYGTCRAGGGMLNLVTGKFEWPQATRERNHEVDRFHPCGVEGALWQAKPGASV